MKPTIRTKEKVLALPDRGLTAHVYLQFNQSSHSYLEDGSSVYTFDFLYFCLHNGRVTPLRYKPKKRTIPSSVVDAIASSITPTGETFTAKNTEYYVAGMFSIVQQDKETNWNLNASDWEVINKIEDNEDNNV